MTRGGAPRQNADGESQQTNPTTSAAQYPTNKSTDDSNVGLTSEQQLTPKHPRSTSPPLFTIPFARIIEADHTSISRIASRTTQPNLRLSTRLRNFTTLLARLIRHDISEELVMRPAFARYLGPEGCAAAMQDRDDHADLKRRLLVLYEGVIDREARGETVDEGELVEAIKGLSAEMAVHMREESGVWLPRFEGVVEESVVLELGSRYARTLVLGPGVCVPTGGVGVEDGSVVVKRCFGDVMEYGRAEVAEFEEILRKLEEAAEKGDDGGYLERRIGEEMKEIRLSGQSDLAVGKSSTGTGKAKVKL